MPAERGRKQNRNAHVRRLLVFIVPQQQASLSSTWLYFTDFSWFLSCMIFSVFSGADIDFWNQHLTTMHRRTLYFSELVFWVVHRLAQTSSVRAYALRFIQKWLLCGCVRYRPIRNAQFLLCNAAAAQNGIADFLACIDTPGK